jgi:hypothetical protein
LTSIGFKEDIIGRKASQEIPRGTPLEWRLIGEEIESEKREKYIFSNYRP